MSLSLESTGTLKTFARWYMAQQCHRRFDTKQGTLDGYLLTSCPDTVRQFILKQIGPCVSPLRDGLVVEQLALDYLNALVCQQLIARGWLLKKQADGAPEDWESADEPARPPTPPTPPPATVTVQAPALKRGRRSRPANRVRWRLCDEDSVEAQLRTVDDKRSPERAELLRIAAERPDRWLPMASARQIDALQALEARYPNFSDVIAWIARSMELAIRTRGPVYLSPILLAGPPGVGKTAFARALAATLSMSIEFRSFAELSSSWLLTGSSRTWSEAQPGIVARLCISAADQTAPMMFIDELDKVSPLTNHPPERALLSLLQAETAARFRDENLNLEIDASPISWIFTANYLELIRPEIRSRMTVFDVPPPTREQMPAIVRSVDAGLRTRTPALGEVFRPLSEDVISIFSEQTPRELTRLLERAYGESAARNRDQPGPLELSPDLVCEMTESPRTAADCSAVLRIPQRHFWMH